jgi:hypothetical protein
MPGKYEAWRPHIERELEVLDRVINYADRMIYEEGQRQYGAVRRLAYGKTVIIETEKQGVLEFRLSAVSQALTGVGDAGYATPHSPIGRLCSMLREGDEDETPRWGEYHVREVRLFDRFDGAQFEPNVRNFLSMTVREEDRDAVVPNLRQTLAGLTTSKLRSTSDGASVPVALTPTADLPEIQAKAPGEQAAVIDNVAEPEVPKEPELTFSTFMVVDDAGEDDDFPSMPDLDDDTEGDVAVVEPEGYFGLSETFFLNRTRDQDAVMSRSPIGPMFVQGVAGSGKTSAALGRTKMLCDFNAEAVADEQEFREIAGHSLSYWEGQFAGQFSQEGSVGYVRTGELIQYLKETCRRLELPHLPVQEYGELRSTLRQHRKVDKQRAGTSRWGGSTEPRTAHLATTMQWLQAADRALAASFALALPRAIPAAQNLVQPFLPSARARALPLVEAGLARLGQELTSLAVELTLAGARGYRLDRLAKRVHACVEVTRQEVLSKDVVWVTIAGKSWHARNEQALAQALVDARVVLYNSNQARLVFGSSKGILDPGLQVLDAHGAEMAWSDTVFNQLVQGTCVVRDALGRTVRGRLSDANDLFMRLLPEAVDKLYVEREGGLALLKVHRGLGRERLELDPAQVATARKKAEAEGAETEGDDDAEDGAQKFRSIDHVFNKRVRAALMSPLTTLADAYADVLGQVPEQFPDRTVAEVVHRQLLKRKLADADIDLLLCLSHIVGRGYAGQPSSLSEPPFHQAVFIDEVQDFTEQQVYLMSQQARPEYRAVTVVGDTAQKLHNGRSIDVVACFPGESVPVVHLKENMRQLAAPALAWFSTCYRALAQEGHAHPQPDGLLAERLNTDAANLQGPDLSVFYDDEDLCEQIVDALERVKAFQTAAVLLPDATSASQCHRLCQAALAERMVDAELSEKIDLSRRHMRHFTTVANAKGLEFDVVIVPRLGSYDLTDPTQVNRLYVALTRAKHRLVLLSEADRPETLFDEVWMHYEDAIAVL